ncbi:MAG: ABC transporter ATP-binding protein [Huintestinicola sp.]|uniref:ABC transporter ATP-binding protein n=1 Tax=Huintestinicola sp. TaxID=2981661 RepID=UPI003F121960
MPVLSVKDISVKYVLGDFKDIGLKDYVINVLTKKNTRKDFWALDGVNFELEKGELLGIVGTNGAGKSTLLKVATGIMIPTKGSVCLNGRAAALLELASGFDGDLTVRENTYLRGALLGYTKEFMEDKYDEIIEFSGLQEFQDLNFRQLSSGMKSRLAFSIASLVNPDLLILDEVLSVGDGVFKEKSEKKMQEIIESGIATILVSHSVSQIRRMSTRVLWLNKGHQIMIGDTEQVCDLYEEFLKTGKLPE